jgi:hypothetical protein
MRQDAFSTLLSCWVAIVPEQSPRTWSANIVFWIGKIQVHLIGELEPVKVHLRETRNYCTLWHEMMIWPRFRVPAYANMSHVINLFPFSALAAMEDTVEISKGPRLSRLEDKQK